MGEAAADSDWIDETVDLILARFEQAAEGDAATARVTEVLTVCSVVLAHAGYLCRLNDLDAESSLAALMETLNADVVTRLAELQAFEAMDGAATVDLPPGAKVAIH